MSARDPLDLSRVTPDFSSSSGKSGIQPFVGIQPSLAPAKFVAGFAGFWVCQCSCNMFY